VPSSSSTIVKMHLGPHIRSGTVTVCYEPILQGTLDGMFRYGGHERCKNHQVALTR